MDSRTITNREAITTIYLLEQVKKVYANFEFEAKEKDEIILENRQKVPVKVYVANGFRKLIENRIFASSRAFEGVTGKETAFDSSGYFVNALTFPIHDGDFSILRTAQGIYHNSPGGVQEGMLPMPTGTLFYLDGFSIFDSISGLSPEGDGDSFTNEVIGGMRTIATTGTASDTLTLVPSGLKLMDLTRFIGLTDEEKSLVMSERVPVDNWSYAEKIILLSGQKIGLTLQKGNTKIIADNPLQITMYERIASVLMEFISDLSINYKEETKEVAGISKKVSKNIDFTLSNLKTIDTNAIDFRNLVGRKFEIYYNNGNNSGTLQNCRLSTRTEKLVDNQGSELSQSISGISGNFE